MNKCVLFSNKHKGMASINRLEKMTYWINSWFILLTQYYFGNQIKEDEMIWDVIGWVAACGKWGKETCTGFWGGNLKERDHLEDHIVDGRIMLKWILKKYDGTGLDKSGSVQEYVAGCCKQSNEPLGPIKYTGKLSNCEIFASEEWQCCMELVRKIPSLSYGTYRISTPIWCTMIFMLEILEKNDDECILILVIYWKKTGLLHTKISNHNIIYSS